MSKSICFSVAFYLSNLLVFLAAGKALDAAEFGLRFDFATVDQARLVLGRRDEFIEQMSPFDRKVRLQSATDLGSAAVLSLAADQVLPWEESEKKLILQATEQLIPKLTELGIGWEDSVLLIKTTGKEESSAAYTRSNAIVFPRQKLAGDNQPPTRLLAHELFHVISRSDQKLRDRLFSLIGFERVQSIQLPNSLRETRLTNPDAPMMEHVIRLTDQDGTDVVVAPYLFSTQTYNESQTSLFSYLNFELLQLREKTQGVWVPVFDSGSPKLITPQHPDYLRQIGENTKYIIHPEEIIADNFAMMLTDAQVKDPELITSIRSSIQLHTAK